MRDVDWPTRDLLTHRVRATPDRTAVVDAETAREWTVRELDDVVDGLTTSLGQENPDRVAVLASTRIGFVTAVHAVLRAGATLVPLNLERPDEELATQLDRTRPDVLICERATEARALSVFEGTIRSLDSPESDRVEPFQPGDESGDPARWRRDEDAVILFTSGTTGTPKAVRLTMGNLVASATASAFRLGVAPGDRWLCCLPTYHMGGLAPLLRTVLYGTTLVLQPSFDTAETARIIETYDVTGVSFVPTQLHRLLEGGWEPPETLETVLVGGAPAGESLVERALERGVPIAPTYGMTETASQIATATPAQARDAPGTVGQPFLFTEVTVVDDGEPVDRGVQGELVVDGPTVTPGYLDEAETERAFGEYGLHTGDVGRRDEDGLLRVEGRVDDTIVTGGESVQPSTVADVLGSHPDVDAVAVVGLPDEEWGERVAALVVPAADRLTVEDVDAYARDRLATYEVPKTVALTSRLPRTASGTVDRDAVSDRLEE